MTKGYSKGASTARKILRDCGLDEISHSDLEYLVSYRGAILVEEEMHNADGRIIHGKNRSIIKINNKIKYIGRKRFTIAHELGHYEMHRDYPIHSDSKSLDWFDSALKNLKGGIQELEANEFASELLMPMEIFKNECRYKKFNPELLRRLAERFGTSITSVAFKCVELDIHPVCIFYIDRGKVKYWKRSDSLDEWVTDRYQMPPHRHSVASEYISAGYEYIYSRENLQQSIDKSLWFTHNQNDNSENYYEYCIPTKQYQTLLSIVWKD
jgi:Zn-dependent peptidase ImmA (M78 family)